MYDLLQRLASCNQFNIVIFGDNVILEEEIECWPTCDFLISFYSTGFPLEKALRYVQEHRPFCVNDLLMQMILWDRRLVLLVLDALDVKTPNRLVANRDSGPSLNQELKEVLGREFNIYFNDTCFPQEPIEMLDYDTLQVGRKIIRKPFVEKPVDGEDHNIFIYFPKSQGGGACKLFRKIAEKSSTFDPDFWHVRMNGSFIYEEYVVPDKYEDVKVYTIGPDHSYAETRKSPSVDGIVLRNSHGKEVRYETELSGEEQEIAKTISMGFAQTICGFDIVRKNGCSFVIDVNGWSFVKDNSHFYDVCARELRKIIFKVSRRSPSLLGIGGSAVERKSSGIWSLKGHVSVIRHGDRTPKGKLKVVLENSYNLIKLFEQLNIFCINENEILVSGGSNLHIIVSNLESTLSTPAITPELKRLELLLRVLKQRLLSPDTKFQLRKIKKTPKILMLILKWGGEFTHAARHQSIVLGEQLRNELAVMNRKIIHNFHVYSSGERRVIATADAFSKSFLQLAEIPSNCIQIKRELLDDTFDGKDQIDECKDILKRMISQDTLDDCIGYYADLKYPKMFIEQFISLIQWHKTKFHERWQINECEISFISNHNQTKNLNSILLHKKWCCFDSVEIFKERWLSIFESFSSKEIYNNSNAINMYDSLKFDAIHNRELLEFLFSDDSSKSGSLNMLNRLFSMSKTLFCFLVPQEYGINTEQKLSIGKNVSGNLYAELIDILKSSQFAEIPFCKFYFTKESHVYTLMNLLFASGICNYETNELDYMTQITFEMYKRNVGSGREFSFRIGISPGCQSVCSALNIHDPNQTHSIYPVARKWITSYIPLSKAIELLESVLI